MTTWWHPLDALLTDLRAGARTWRRAPLSALGVVLLLALGMAAIVTVARPLLMLAEAPLPFPGPSQLVRIGGDLPIFNRYSWSFEREEALAEAFSDLMAYGPIDLVDRLSVDGQTGGGEDVVVHAVTTRFFATLGITPMSGRDWRGSGPALPEVVITQRLRSRIAGPDVEILGATVSLIGRDYTVVGVVPAELAFPEGTDVWTRMGDLPHREQGTQLVGRLRPGISIQKAETVLASAAPRNVDRASGLVGSHGPLLQPLSRFINGDRRFLLTALTGLAALFLLLMCCGAAHVLFAHDLSRRQELLIRIAIGAGSGRLQRQRAIELLLLTGSAGVLAVVISLPAPALLGYWLGDPASQASQLQTVASVSLLIAVVTIVTTLFAVLFVPARGVGSARRDANETLTTRSYGRADTGTWAWLTGAQVSLAFGLLVAMGVLTSGVAVRLNLADGLSLGDVAWVTPILPRLAEADRARARLADELARRSDTTTQRVSRSSRLAMQRVLEPYERLEISRDRQFYLDAAVRLGSLVGVQSVGVMHPVPFSAAATRALQSPMWVAPLHDRQGDRRRGLVEAIVGRATPEAFNIIGVELVEGRHFVQEEMDLEAANQEAIQFPSSDERRKIYGAAIVSRALAGRLWPGRAVLGKEFVDRGLTIRRVVGVVADFHQSRHTVALTPAAYYPFTGALTQGSFVVKLSPGAEVDRLIATVSHRLAPLAPSGSRIDAGAIVDEADGATSRLMVAAVLVGLFALCASTVAVLGIYSSAAIEISHRRRDWAIRQALGASPWQLAVVFQQHLVGRLIVALVPGALLGWVAARLIDGFLVSIDTLIVPFAGAALLLICATVAATLPAALRTARTDQIAAELRR